MVRGLRVKTAGILQKGTSPCPGRKLQSRRPSRYRRCARAAVDYASFPATRTRTAGTTTSNNPNLKDRTRPHRYSWGSGSVPGSAREATANRPLARGHEDVGTFGKALLSKPFFSRHYLLPPKNKMYNPYECVQQQQKRAYCCSFAVFPPDHRYRPTTRGARQAAPGAPTHTRTHARTP